MVKINKLLAIPKINFVLHKHFDDQDKSRQIDVVYIHGLNGDPWKTWAHKANIDNYWPYWLQEDCVQSNQEVGVWSLGYDAPLAVFDDSQSLRLDDLADELRKYLETTEIGNCGRKVIFISHSLGGMMAKKMLVRESATMLQGSIAQRTCGIAFIAVPHFGLLFADLMQILRRGLPWVYPNKVFEDLRKDAASLTGLYSSFVEYAGKQSVLRHSFWEDVATKCPPRLIARVIPWINNEFQFIEKDGLSIERKNNAGPGYFATILHGESHLSISKPASQDYELYKSINLLVKTCLTNLQATSPTAIPAANRNKTGIQFFHVGAKGGIKSTSVIGTSVIAKWLIERKNENKSNSVKTFAWSFSVQKANSQLEEISTDLFFEKALTFFCDEELAKNPESGYSKAGKLAQLVADQKALLILHGIDVLQDDKRGRTDRFKSLDIAILFLELLNRQSRRCICTIQGGMPTAEDGDGENKDSILGIQHTEFNMSSALIEGDLEFGQSHRATDSTSPLVKSIGIKTDRSGEGHEMMRGVEGHQKTINSIRALCAEKKYDDAFMKYTEELNGQPNQFRLYQIGAYGTALEALSCFFDKDWNGVWKNQTPPSMAVKFEASACLKAAGRFDEACTVLKGNSGNFEEAAFSLANSDLHYLQGSIQESVKSAESALGRIENENSGSLDWIDHIARLRLELLTAQATAAFASGDSQTAEDIFNKWRKFTRRRPSFLGQGVFEYCDFLLADADRAAWQTFLKPTTPKPETAVDAIGPAAGVKRRRVRRLISATVKGCGEDLWILDIGLFHLILGRLALYDVVRYSDERASIAKHESRLHLDAAVDCIRSAGILPSLPPALMARARLKYACNEKDEAKNDLDEARQIVEHGPMPLLKEAVLLHRVRLFGSAG